MNTTTKEECIISINKFLKSHSYDDAMKVLNIFLEDKDEKSVTALIQAVSQNPMILNMIMPKVLKELETKYLLVELSKNNNPILIY